MTLKAIRIGEGIGGTHSRDGEFPLPGFSNAGSRSEVEVRDGTPTELPPHPPGPVTPGWSNLVAVEGGEDAEGGGSGTAPVLTSLTPATAVLGSANFTVSCIGEGFTPDAVIVFNGFDEPTTVVSPTEVTTGVNMSVWAAPAAVPVLVRTAAGESAPLTFTFTEA